MHGNPANPGSSQDQLPEPHTPVRSGPSLPARVARRSKPLARRFALGMAYGTGTGVGGFVIGYVIWLIQSR